MLAVATFNINLVTVKPVAAMLSVNVWTITVADATHCVNVLIETVAMKCFNI